jgi:DNA mismatch repair protein MutS2
VQENKIDSHALKVLEFDKIINFLGRFASTELGKQHCHNILPQINPFLVQERLQETSEMKAFLGVSDFLPFNTLRDITFLLKRAEPEGGVLLPLELWEILSLLESSRLVKDLIKPRKEQSPALWSIANKIKPLSPVEDQIGKAINAEGEILDSASKELARIRLKINQVKIHIRAVLEEVLNHPETSLFAQEKIITLRHDRYVIPLKADFKKRIPGIVHDQSHNQATYFIEPFHVVEHNNELTLLKEEMKREEVRILKNLTMVVRGEKKTLLENQKYLGILDSIQARARMSAAMKAQEPKMIKEKEINFLQARHPILLNQSFPDALEHYPRFDNSTITPVDLFFPAPYLGIVITGANMGGKTATLKTVGLLTLMVQSGMHIPVAEGTTLPIWEKIFADIGDEQNLEENISTFSSHVVHLNEILSRADEHSLVLLDEVGSGTDPEEGAALGSAILDELRSRKTKVIITSHLNLLKAYGISHPDVLNVSVGFNPITLKPTFKLVFGIPGTSKALETASRLGISPQILAHAKSYLKENDRRILALTEHLEDMLQKLHAIKINCDEILNAAARYEEIMAKFVDNVKGKQKILFDHVEKKAQRLFREIEIEVKKLRKSNFSFKSFNEIKNKVSATVAKTSEDLKRIELSTQLYEGLKKGDKLSLGGKEGKVVAVDLSSKRVEIQIGGVRLKTGLDELARIECTPMTPSLAPKESSSKINVTTSEPLGPVSSLNLIGLRVDEAIPLVEKFIDNALLYGINELRIIHGMGTGRLRLSIHQFLQNHSRINNFFLGPPLAGGAGVTIVELEP